MVPGVFYTGRTGGIGRSRCGTAVTSWHALCGKKRALSRACLVAARSLAPMRRDDPAVTGQGSVNPEPPASHRFRTVWISDLHLGTPGCRAHALLDFLREVEC